MKITTKLWIGIGVLICISPLGLLLPEHFKAGSAWGEWGADEMPELVGYLPKGLAKLSGLWSAPVPDYAFKGQEGLGALSFGYIISAVLGVAIIVAVVLLLGKFISKK